MRSGIIARIILVWAAAAAAAVAAVLLRSDLAASAIAASLLALSGILAWRVIARISAFTRSAEGATREIAGGNLGARVELPGNDELGTVAGDFDRMAAAVEERVVAASLERSHLLAALNASVDAVVAIDQDNNIMFANASVYTLLGRRPEEMVGQQFAWLVSTPEVIQGLRDCRSGGKRSSHVFERQGRRYLRAIITPIEGGDDWASLVVFHDLTDVRRTEQVRRDFIANVSHELRTPLAAVKSVIETLQGGAMNDAAVAADFLQRADREVDRLVQMVEELLELSRIESGDIPARRDLVEPAEPVRSASDRLRPQAERAGLDFVVEIAADLPAVRGDRGGLERAVVNLVQNAIRFTPEGGRVTVSATQDASGVLISVADNGVGIDPDDLPRVFERFFKADRARRSGGTGLGLALVKHTVEAHGGRIEVRSEAGEGATFRVWLPAANVVAARVSSATGQVE
jgi:two-component system phosphate regulon sensor histidine kinase PhoR